METTLQVRTVRINGLLFCGDPDRWVSQASAMVFSALTSAVAAPKTVGTADVQHHAELLGVAIVAAEKHGGCNPAILRAAEEALTAARAMIPLIEATVLAR